MKKSAYQVHDIFAAMMVATIIFSLSCSSGREQQPAKVAKKPTTGTTQPTTTTPNFTQPIPTQYPQIPINNIPPNLNNSSNLNLLGMFPSLISSLVSGQPPDFGSLLSGAMGGGLGTTGYYPGFQTPYGQSQIPYGQNQVPYGQNQYGQYQQQYGQTQQPYGQTPYGSLGGTNFGSQYQNQNPYQNQIQNYGNGI